MGRPTKRRARCIEATTVGQWSAYNNKFRASASSAADDRVAAEKIHLNCLFNDEFRVRRMGDASLEAMKAFVIEKNLQHHKKMAAGARKTQSGVDRTCRFPIPQPAGL
jgi:hypothetical protein